ncbi:XRE family transcriptional regulator [Sphingosinicella sp. BN140058]|nr:XRE family transcriptional regulator [Sphingosinicella sp. BN140058]
MRDSSVRDKVAAAIRHHRKLSGQSQEKVAHRARIDRSFYGRIERGTQNLALETLCLIALALEIHPSELLRDIESSDLLELKGSRVGPLG